MSRRHRRDNKSFASRGPVAIPEAGRVPRLSAESLPAGSLYSRNWAFVDPSLQACLSRPIVFAAGTGLGSVITTLAARTGFQRFILADGDTVALSNLNRQVFTAKHLGQNKASVTARIIRRIAPQGQVEVIPRYLALDDFPALVDRTDIIINTIDLSDPAFLELNRVAKIRHKPVLFPMNLGWGGMLLIFTPESVSLDEFIGLGSGRQDDDQLTTKLIQRVLEQLRGDVSPYLRQLLPQFLTRDTHSWPCDPQLGTATYVSAALTVRAAVALTAGEPVRVAPEIVWCDVLTAVAPPRVGMAEAGTRERQSEEVG